MLVDTLYVEIFRVVVLGHGESPSLETPQKINVELSLDLLGSFDFWKDVFTGVDSLLSRQLANVCEDSWQKFTIFHHDNRFNVAISDQLV